MTVVQIALTVTLVRAVDGDTIKVKYNGKVKTVRYLLVDTPETKKPNSCVQPYGKEASEENKKLVESGKLELEFDKGGTDKYGRLLAYVYADGKSVQEQLLKDGLARVAYIYPPNTKYVDEYQKVENTAKKKHIAIWSKSGYATDKGFNGCVVGKTKTALKSDSAKKSLCGKQRLKFFRSGIRRQRNVCQLYRIEKEIPKRCSKLPSCLPG